MTSSSDRHEAMASILEERPHGCPIETVGQLIDSEVGWCDLQLTYLSKDQAFAVADRMRCKLFRIIMGVTLAAAMMGGSVSAQEERTTSPTGFDDVYLIVLENHSFDDALYGPSPFLLGLSQTQGLATYYFGVTHPSLPNYIAMISGDYFGIQDDAPSCFAPDLVFMERWRCHRIEVDNLADQLERNQLTWSAYLEDLPSVGSLQSRQPTSGSNPLYAQKHNPFVYFEKIARNPARLRNIKPFDAFAGDVNAGAANFNLIVPNQCNDGHGLPMCADASALVRAYDAFTEKVIMQIRASPSWTNRSAIIIVFDEGKPPLGMRGSPAHVDCCGGTGQGIGGNHIPLIVFTKNGRAKTSSVPMNHYSLLATIEDGFGLERLGHAATAVTLAARPVAIGAHQQCRRTAARRLQAPHQDPDRPTVAGDRGDAVLGAARFRTDHHAQGRRLADAGHQTNRRGH